MSKIRGMTWQYEDVLELVVRSRPLHLDVRFGAKLPRFRLVSSYIQPIVNELYFRCTEVHSSCAVCSVWHQHGTYQIAHTHAPPHAPPHTHTHTTDQDHVRARPA